MKVKTGCAKPIAETSYAAYQHSQSSYPIRPVEHQTRSRKHLVEQVKVVDVRCHKRAPHFAGLEEQKRVVEQRNAARPSAKPYRHACQHSRFAEGPGRGDCQAMRGDVVDHATDRRQRSTGSWVVRVQAPEKMGHLRQSDCGVVYDPKLEQVVDFWRRLSLENVQIDAGIEQKFGSGMWSPNPRQVRIGTARDGTRLSLRLDSPQRRLGIKRQIRGRARSNLCARRV